MTVAGFVLGVINIMIVVVILLLVGALVLWFCNYMGISVPDMVRKLYIAAVALIALYMLAALLLGMPSIRIISHATMPLALT